MVHLVKIILIKTKQQNRSTTIVLILLKVNYYTNFIGILWLKLC